MTQPLAPGATIGHFRIVRELGRGGMGVVYRATDMRLGRDVALKVIKPDTAADPRFVARFWREAKAAAHVAHPNAVRVLESGEANGVFFIATELAAGGTLSDRIHTSGPMPWREVVRLGAGIARGLAAIHAAGIIHRDVKPANILLDGTGAPQLSDFGLSRLTETSEISVAAAITRDGERVGTVAYMAPEQIDGVAVDARADLYSLGATLYAMATSHPPFEGDDTSVMKHTLFDAPPALRSVVPAVSPGFGALVSRLLAKEPGERPTTANEVAAELEALLAAPAAPVKSAGGTSYVVILAVAVVIAGGAIAFGLSRGTKAPESMTSPTPVVMPTPTPTPAPASSPPRPAAVPSPDPTPSPEPTPSPTPDESTLPDWPVVPAVEFEFSHPELRPLRVGGTRLSITHALDFKGEERKSSGIAALACSVKTGLGAVSTPDGRILIFRLADLGVVEVLPALSGRQVHLVGGLDWSPAGDRLVAAIEKGPIVLWQRRRGSKAKVLWALPVDASPRKDQEPRALFTREDNPRVVFTTRGGVAAVDSSNREPPRKFESTADTFEIAPGPGSRVAVTTHGGDVSIWDAAKGERVRTLKPHVPEKGRPAVSPSGKVDYRTALSIDDAGRIFSGSNDAFLRLEGAEEESPLFEESVPGKVAAVLQTCITPDGRFGLTSHADAGGTYSIRLWSLAESKLIPLDRINLVSPDRDELTAMKPDALALLPDGKTAFVRLREGHLLRIEVRD